MTFKTTITGLAFAAAMAVAPASANAAQYINFNGYNGTFGNTHVTKGQFVDNYTFTVPTTGRLWATVTSVFTTPGTNLNFWIGGNKINTTQFTIVSQGITEYRTITALPVTAGLQTMRIAGQAQGDATYSGTLAFAVPEPATWALLILGFGGVAFAMRRRSTKVQVSYA